MLLNNEDRIDQNAYHEFFLVMQSNEEDDFVIENLEFGGGVKEPAPLWWDEHSSMSALVPSITISRPYVPQPEDEDEDEDGVADEDKDEDDGLGPEDDVEVPRTDRDQDDVEWSDSADGGCSVVPSSPTAPLALLSLCLVGLVRRRTVTMR
jgi:MYXO-CTERM domain-containing protein